MPYFSKPMHYMGIELNNNKTMDLNRLLALLDGKKAKIVGIVGLTLGFFTLKGIIDGDTSTYILSVINILAGTAAFATEKALGKSRREK